MDNKYYGNIKDFAPVREDRSAIYISYGKEDIDKVHCTWYELCYYKKQHSTLTIEEVRKDVIADINSHTDEKILSGFVWNGKNVWLSIENQINYKNALDLAIQTNGENLPVSFRFGESNNPDYYQFNTIEELKSFWIACNLHIWKCIVDGWNIKDSIDWSVYELAYEEIH